MKLSHRQRKRNMWNGSPKRRLRSRAINVSLKLLNGWREEYASNGTSGYLGVNTDTTYSSELPNPRRLIQGFRVNSVIAKGPADKADIRVGDVIIGVGDEAIHFTNPKDPAEFRREITKISSLPSFKLVMLTVFRADNSGSKVLQIPVILGKGTPSVSEVRTGESKQSSTPRAAK